MNKKHNKYRKLQLDSNLIYNFSRPSMTKEDKTYFDAMPIPQNRTDGEDK
jgi:hypothetical protein